MISIDREMLWQWDYGQRVQLHDVSVGTAVHFSNAAIKPNALVTDAYEDGEGVYADIPDILLQTAGTLTAYIYLEDGDEGHTEYRKMFIVRDREKPDDYVYTEDDVKTWVSLEERIKVLEESGGGAAGGLIRPLSTIGEIDGVKVVHVPDKDRVELTVEMTADSMNSVFGGNVVYKNDFLNARQLQLLLRVPGMGKLFLWELFEDDLITVTNYPNKKFIMVSTNRMIVSLTYDENGQFVSENKTYQANVQKVEEMIAEAVAGLPQSDWNQNDKTAQDFIKNKPFGEDEPVVVVPETTWECSMSFIPNVLPHIEIGNDMILTIRWDGEVYEYIPVIKEGEPYQVGNETVCGIGNNVGNGEPFLFIAADDSTMIFANVGTHTFSISTTKLIQIDGYYVKRANQTNPGVVSYDDISNHIGEYLTIPTYGSITFGDFFRHFKGHGMPLFYVLTEDDGYMIMSHRGEIMIVGEYWRIPVMNKNHGNITNVLVKFPTDEAGYTPDDAKSTEIIIEAGGTSDIPDTLPNPHPLTFTGAVEATYDGSTPVAVEIPSGDGGAGVGEWKLIADVELTERVATITHKLDKPLKEIIILLYSKTVLDNGDTKTGTAPANLEFRLSGNQFRPFYILNNFSNYDKFVWTKWKCGCYGGVFDGTASYMVGSSSGPRFGETFNANQEPNALFLDDITEFKIASVWNFVANVGNVGRFEVGTRYMVYGVEA